MLGASSLIGQLHLWLWQSRVGHCCLLLHSHCCLLLLPLLLLLQGGRAGTCEGWAEGELYWHGCQS